MAADIIAKQNHLFGLISRTLVNLKKLGNDNITRGILQTRVQQLEKNWEKFDSNHEQLLSVSGDIKKDDYFVTDMYSLCEDEYYRAKVELLDLLENHHASSSSAYLNTSNGASSTNHHQRSLPKITLPKFSGKYSEGTPFHDFFLSIIGNNEDLTPVEKLHYLKINVTKIIASIPITADNYNRAWEKLKSRYQNKRSLVNSYLDIQFSIKSLHRKNARDLENLRSTVAEILEALSALGGPVDSWDFFLVYFICRRLDVETHEAWEIHLGGATDPPTYKALNTFLEGRVRPLETVDARGPISKPAGTQRPIKTTPPAQIHASTAPTSLLASPRMRTNVGFVMAIITFRRVSSIGMPLRSSDVISLWRKNCATIASAVILLKTVVLQNGVSSVINVITPHYTRADLILELHLRPGLNQHSVLNPHLSGIIALISAESSPSSTASSPQVSASHHASLRSHIDGPALLATALVRAVSPPGCEVVARALVDQGSELSFVRESLVQKLHLPRRRARILLCGIGAQRCSTTRGAVLLHLRNRTNPEVEIVVETYILPKLTGQIPSSPIKVMDAWSHLSDLTLADPAFATPGFVDILLGANIYGLLLLNDIRKGDLFAPVAQNILLGWIVSGPTSVSQSSGRISQGFLCSVERSLHEIVSDFWAQETVPPSSGSAITKDDAECEDHFKRTHCRDLNGRYIVRLPFKTRPTSLGASQGIAVRALATLQRRFRKNPVFRQLYVAFMNEYSSLGHMEVARSQTNSPVYYLPHHGVMRESSVTTKLRVVFNGSQKTDAGMTLNDCLHSGPKIQTDLIDVLLRWRLLPYVFSADVEKMYRRIIVHPEDRGFQRILWSGDSVHAAVDYELATLTYGLTSAPFLAIRVLHQLAADEGSRFPLAADVISQNVYVDDVLSGANTLEIAQEKAAQVNQLFQSGGFQLQKWASNSDTILDLISDDKRLNFLKSFEEGPILRALGIAWNPASDMFIISFQPDLILEETPTKRSVLSSIARLFDPLGWLAPVLITAKIFLQSLWRINLTWDEHLPAHLEKRWREFSSALRSANVLSVPRWVGTTAASIIELHGCSDASQDALAAVLYVRVPDETFHARTFILLAKTKVSPLKQTTIARLELCAAVLLAKLTAKVH